MSGLLRRAVAVTTILLTLLGITVLAVRGTGPGLTAGPPPASTPAVTAQQTASASPSPTPGAAQIFGQIESQVRTLRGLAAPTLARPAIITRAQLEAELRGRFDRDYPPARRAADNVMFRALGLLTAKQDVGELQLRLLSGQVIGFYDDETKRMTLVSDSGIGPQVKITYAHEYTHALQDRAFRLGSLQLDAAGEDDRDLARLSLVEGDATAVMFQWALDHMTPQELLGVSQGPAPNLSGIPGWMVDNLEFPYTAGQQFVTSLQASGGTSAVNQAFRKPPASTEQILHSDKYLRHEAPVKVSAPQLARALGSGWRTEPADTLGEAMIRFWLRALAVTDAEVQEAADGWGGDRLVAASGPGGATAVAWDLVWDTPADAAQFTQIYRLAARHLTSVTGRLVPISDRETLVVQGSSAAIVDRAVAGLR
jgi:hypothetical protein